MHLFRAALAAVVLAALGGCAQMQEDALSLIPKPPVKPTLLLANSADTSPPILQPGCYAIPDRAWDTEGLSEAEPWAPRCKAGQVWPGYESHGHRLVKEQPVRVKRVVHQRTK